MSKAQNSAKIIDFQAFKERREQPVEANMPQQEQPTPLFAWYPIWVLVPQFPHA